jgi:two-component SAPR family response regulator
MFNAIIVDDEKPALDVLKLLLEKTGQICVVGSFMSAADALLKIQSLKPDVAFLDIQMSEMTGLELAEKILEAGGDIEIVFVTAYDKYALEAFRVNAIDYILKPFSPGDIMQAITRLKKAKPLPDANHTSADKGRVYCFGRLSVYGAGCGETVKWRTSKVAELFAFMLQNLDNEVPRWKIAQALWPECEEDKQLSVNLYTTVYKAKKTLLSANIKFDFTFKNGKYKMELPDVYIDAAAFAAITDGEITVTTASLDRYKRAFSLYKGNYLGENEYFWSQNEAEKYSIRYRRLVSELVKYYTNRSDYLAAEQILRDALTIIPLDDDLNTMLLKLFFMKRDRAALVMHYNKIKELYQNELGIAPSATIQNLFHKTSKL